MAGRIASPPLPADASMPSSLEPVTLFGSLGQRNSDCPSIDLRRDGPGLPRWALVVSAEPKVLEVEGIEVPEKPGDTQQALKMERGLQAKA